MTRSEARTRDAWRSFDLWAWIVPILFALPALYGWFNGAAANAESCCSAKAPAPAPAVVVAPTPAPTPPPEAVVPAPTVPAAPVVDCAKITEGVSVPFATASARLTEAGTQALDQTISCLNSGSYVIGGHTDSDGEAASNTRLSEARANAAKEYLVTKGVAAERLTTVGYGETTPIADNATTEGKARNRRITFSPK